MRIGIDLGGTKIAAIALDEDDRVLFEKRIATPADGNLLIVEAICSLVGEIEKALSQAGSVGIGIPGSPSPRTGLIRNANSTILNQRPLQKDLESRLQRPVRLANDANCFALSESHDGAAQGARVVFGVIIGTGCGGGLVVDGKAVLGRHAIAGEWGHTPLPWPLEDEYPGHICWCGRKNCLETWISGTALEQDHHRATGQAISAIMVMQQAAQGNAGAQAALERHQNRLARGLAMITNLLDPDVIVLGGGLSNMDHLYGNLADEMSAYVFSDYTDIDIRRPAHGDASGVRGAARLWEI